MNHQDQVASNIDQLGSDANLRENSFAWVRDTAKYKYSYNFSWLGRPIIQYPQDMVAMQEIIWQVQPDLIIETGIAHGGSLIFSASMQELNAACGGPQDAEVLGIDIDIRAHNREAIKAHPMAKRISMIQGSSIAPDVIEQVKSKAVGRRNNPKTAVRKYLKTHPEFEIDKRIDHKLLISVAPDGYLKRLR